MQPPSRGAASNVYTGGPHAMANAATSAVSAPSSDERLLPDERDGRIG